MALKSSKRTFSKSNWVTIEEANPSEDIEPPRKKRHDSDSEDDKAPVETDPAVETLRVDENGDIEPPRARGRKLNREIINEISVQQSAGTVYRDSSGRIVSKETAQVTKKEMLEKLNNEQLNKWGKGTKQLHQEEERAKYEENVSKQPLRNTEVSEEIDEELKNVARFGDPMKDLIEKGKKKQEGVIVLETKYKAPPNRYEIQPGHRWDGVDRGNGFEKKMMLAQNERKVNAAEAYKWRTEDM